MRRRTEKKQSASTKKKNLKYGTVKEKEREASIQNDVIREAYNQT